MSTAASLIGGGSTKIHGYVEAGRNRHLSGYEALWFARSRSDSSDYDRVLRQKCVMRAMLNQFDPITVLTKFNSIAAASREVVATDIPTSEIGTMIDLALKAKALPVSSVAMMPPLINPSSPDFDKVRRTIQTKIEASEVARAGWPTQCRQTLQCHPKAPDIPPPSRHVQTTILKVFAQPNHLSLLRK